MRFSFFFRFSLKPFAIRTGGFQNGDRRELSRLEAEKLTRPRVPGLPCNCKMNAMKTIDFVLSFVIHQIISRSLTDAWNVYT